MALRANVDETTQLTLQADRGPSMKAKATALLLAHGGEALDWSAVGRLAVLDAGAVPDA